MNSVAVLFCAGLLLAGVASAAEPNPVSKPEGSRLTLELTGTVTTRDGEILHLTTDLGKVVIRTRSRGKVEYHALLEADASQNGARELLKSFAVSAHETSEGVSLKGQTSDRRCSGRLWVTLEVNVPRSYSVDVSTGGGSIELEDINGHVALSTLGGNIVAGNIGGSAHLSTDGGHITVKNVFGELVAVTGGGHITTGAITGNASLRTTGGHIRAASVAGTAHLETGGGNVALEHSGTELVAETSGGQIEVGEAAGLVRARTGGGGIRVVRASGPANLQAVGGNIYLTQVDSGVKALANAGGITAWFASPAKLTSTCDLQSNDGDIVVYLPRQLAVTIDASVQMGSEHSLIVDPAFPLKVSYDVSSLSPRVIRAEGTLNGGGEVLRLRTVAGNIRLALSDTNKQIQIYKTQMDQLKQQMDLQLRILEKSQQSSEGSSQP